MSSHQYHHHSEEDYPYFQSSSSSYKQQSINQSASSLSFSTPRNDPFLTTPPSSYKTSSSSSYVLNNYHHHHNNNNTLKNNNNNNHPTTPSSSESEHDTEDEDDDYYFADDASFTLYSSPSTYYDDNLLRTRLSLESYMDTLKHQQQQQNNSIMEQTYCQLAIRALDVLANSNKDRIIISIAGVPGSGKTTLATKVAQLLSHHYSYSNNNMKNMKQFSQTVSMDGYHLTRAQLDKFPDPKEAHKRRGSPWTFDANGVVSMAKTLYESTLNNNNNQKKILQFPSFDHAVKDPTPNGITISLETKIVFLEGLYLSYSMAPWNKIREYMDETWMINVDLEVSKKRLANRHLQAGLVKTLQQGFQKVQLNDGLNAQLIMQNRVEPDLWIQSYEI